MWRGVFTRIEFVDREYINPKKKILKNLDTQEIMTVEIQDDIENVSVEGTRLNAENLNKNFSEAKEISISPTEPTADEVLWVKRGKNLLNFPSETIIINGITSNVSGSTATISGTTEQSWANICNRYFGKALEAGTYTFSTDISLTNLTVICRLYYEDNTFINMAVHRATGETNATVTVTKPIKSYYVYITDMTVGTVINSTVFNMQLQEGSVATDYEEYIETTVNVKENGSFNEILNVDEVNNQPLIQTGSYYTSMQTTIEEYKDEEVIFDKEYLSPPTVVIGKSSVTTAAWASFYSVSAINVTTTGFTIRVIKSTGAYIYPSCNWIAIGNKK